jgi:SAM-dependent methyltransferase
MADDAIRSEQSGWSAPDSVEYYRRHRSQPEDLYESERFFLPDVLSKVESVLDVGCAAGGFSRVMRAFNPALRYVGVDITPELVEAARRDHPDCEFHIGDGLHYPFPPGSFDLVHCSGVLHLNSRYPDMVRSMWEQTRRYLLFDVRLTRGPSVTGRMRIDFDGTGAGAAATLPYHILNLDDWLALLQALRPAPAVLQAKGYTHAVAAAASLPVAEAIMAVWLLTKGAAQAPRIELALGD